MKCYNCEAPMSEGTDYCVICGIPRKGGVYMCPKCKHTFDPDYGEFCCNCGEYLKKAQNYV